MYIVYGENCCGLADTNSGDVLKTRLFHTLESTIACILMTIENVKELGYTPSEEYEKILSDKVLISHRITSNNFAVPMFCRTSAGTTDYDDYFLIKVDVVTPKDQTIVTEYCPHCENESSMFWNVDEFGYKAFCPHCGKLMMLCAECCLRDGDYEVNYAGTCRRCKRK